MRSLEILMGWLVMFVVICWMIFDIADDLAKHPGWYGYGLTLGSVSVGVMAIRSIWRDRLA